MSPLKVHVAVIGARQHYAVARLLQQAGMLGRLYTDLYVDEKSWATRLMTLPLSVVGPDAKRRLIGNSAGDYLPPEKIVAFNLFGLKYRWGVSRAGSSSTLNRLYIQGAAAFAKRVARHGLDGAQALYSYNGPSAELFRHAKKQGILCILEQILIPQGKVRRLMQGEMERWPGWEPALRFDSSQGALEEREEEEWRLADLIIGSSPFVLEGLREWGVPAEKCSLIPSGVPLEMFPLKEGAGLPADRCGSSLPATSV